MFFYSAGLPESISNGDNLKAVEYERKALGIMNSNNGKPSINPKDLLPFITSCQYFMIL